MPRLTRSICPRQRLEERGRPHDRVPQSGLDQKSLERELRLLKREQRPLHADSRKQHDMTDAGIPRRCQSMHVRLMVNGPSIARHASA